jgi:hypothetical protein
MFESAKEVLDEVSLLIKIEIDVARRFAVRFRGNDDVHSFGLSGSDYLVGVIAFVPNEVFPLGRFDELGRFGGIVDISGREMEVDGITQSVHKSVDFGGKASARASNTLTLGPPFPPAECWWALT